MKRTISAVLVLLVTLLSVSPARAQNSQRGAVLGGLMGALTGAAIGEHNDEAGAGALIGGAVGLIAGSALGEARDQEEARYRFQQRQQTYQRLSRAVSTSDVVTMTVGRVSDSVIINQIRQNGVDRELEVSDVIFLHRQGVSEPVISAMQHARLATSAPPVHIVRRPPVVIQEHHYVAPRPYYRIHHHRPLGYCPPRQVYRPGRSSFHWGVQFGH